MGRVLYRAKVSISSVTVFKAYVLVLLVQDLGMNGFSVRLGMDRVMNVVVM